MNDTPEILLDKPPVRVGEINDKQMQTQMLIKGLNPEDKIIIKERDNYPMVTV